MLDVYSKRQYSFTYSVYLLVLCLDLLEGFRFEDVNEYEYEIWLSFLAKTRCRMTTAITFSRQKPLLTGVRYLELTKSRTVVVLESKALLHT